MPFVPLFNCGNYIPQKQGGISNEQREGGTFSHINWKDRLRIEKMLKEKKGKAKIARTLRVDYTTIMREIKRGLTVQRDTNLVDREVYCAETAERKYQENLRAKGPDIKLGNDHKLANHIEGKIADDGYSPEAALHKIKEDGLTFSVTLSKWTVYKYINDGVFLRVTNKSLPMGGKRKTEYKKVQAARVPKGDSIEDRPVEVATREEPFHWEMDSVLSAKEGGSKKRFLTMTERTSRADLMFLNAGRDNGKRGGSPGYAGKEAGERKLSADIPDDHRGQRERVSGLGGNDAGRDRGWGSDAHILLPSIQRL